MVAELYDPKDPHWGGSYDNTSRGLPDTGVAHIESELAKVAALVVAGQDKGGFGTVVLQSVSVRNNGKGADTGRHAFKGLTRETMSKVNFEVIRILQVLANIAAAKV